MGRSFARPTALPPRFATSSARPRPYPAHLSLAPTPLRPHCMARERLLLWLPLTSRTQTTGPVSVEDLQRVADVMAWAWAESTLETYGSGLLIYHVFCDVRNMRKLDRAPTSKQLIKSWVAALAGSYSADAVSNFVAGARWFGRLTLQSLTDLFSCTSMARAASAHLGSPRQGRHSADQSDASACAASRT